MATIAPSAEDFYPAGPRTVPSNLVDLPRGYVRQALLVLFCLYLFLILYAGLLAGALWLVYYATWQLPWIVVGGGSRGPAVYLIFVKLPAIAASAMLCLFLIKGLFKRPRRERGTMIEIRREEHPRLFAFINRLCQEVQAPLPKRVYVNHEVNAAVFYDASILGLFWPVRKNLLIGLGLVNVMNLSEFKAALAHEFGHFSQSAMRLGSYVYTANRLILAMVYERDWWDDWLDRWKSLDIRLSWLAYILAGITWLLRKVLGWMFLLLTLTERGLSRAMEYHADKVAVAAAGSEALARCLYKLQPGSEALENALADLYWASERNLYTRDLYYHQSRALERLRKSKNDPNYGIPPPIPQDPRQRRPLFSPQDQQRVAPWDTHPPHYLREQNACDPYVIAPQDERSPWVLFGRDSPDAAQLRQKITLRVYRSVLGIRKKNLPLQPAEAVQQEIDAEHEALSFAPKYQGLYDDRYLFAEDLEDWVQEAELSGIRASERVPQLQQVYSQDWRQVSQRWTKLLEELQTVEAIAEGKNRPSDGKFSALGKTWPVAKAQQVQRRLEAELKRIAEQLRQADKTVFQAYYQMAKELSPQACEALLSYYRWARRLEGWCTQLRRWAGIIEMIEYMLSADADFGRQEGANIVEAFQNIRRELEPVSLEMYQTQVPKLLGLTEQSRVSAALFPQGLVSIEPVAEGEWLGEWLGQLSQQVCGARTRAHRLYARSVSTILALQRGN
ncbi:Protease HtpX [bacterium HR36]|nr:Protease HtpX [bacterium HR36]